LAVLRSFPTRRSSDLSDAGFAPRELLLASLGADTAMALRKHAVQNDWTLGKITVGVRWSRSPSGADHIERRLSFGRPLTAEQKRSEEHTSELQSLRHL